ncbi:tRNA (uridine(34)/cytosine(34)/5-carboxymethylaminomethyluridine(34)-2'-O)-methyltransferase TrmL [Clostridium grantii]|uniref:Putative tRNA (cytidine(34)-2'-O)-methyltransferase n=1 Tax=Clostridium grantii DSM 8605 TaxID=1121316 RepID=A0A1M5RRL2_9CLOT|nr:tRNA (uridine(34)/cytosine(34)/5-carboxymethylaminomethyluridine(34)-2'-O)-methyltransferase TrmL [Clostridium grantii]SHH28914.1 tRNA (cytidine/uridine-2'-O-)-methyltransferase [Clostridium grantii DSM 8605]
MNEPNLNIVLFQPEIPQNTGNIGRTCVLVNANLHLIKPLGFNIEEKKVRRAGLDYWPYLNYEIHESFEDFLSKYPKARIFLATTKGSKYYSEAKYEKGDFIVFGRESSGLPKEIMEKYKETAIKIPMIDTTTRSLNLSNTVSIFAYEALRQMNFPNMK